MNEVLTWQDSGQKDIFKGSKSFSLASLFFDRKQKYGAWALYRWCRFVDDEIDEAPSDEIPLKLKRVQAKTQEAFHAPQLAQGVYKSLGWAAVNFQIREQFANDLIQGLEMDAQGAHIATEEDLLHYCYCVAGTVGLMMCAVMGVRQSQAFSHAKALGQAMQLTNIARDLSEDLKRERIYIPTQWLEDAGVSAAMFAQDPSVRAIFAQKLLSRAENSYAEGFAGVRYLPFRAALAVSIAAFIYRAIGLRIQKNPLHYQHHRAVVPFYEKIFWILRGIVFTMKTRGFRDN